MRGDFLPPVLGANPPAAVVAGAVAAAITSTVGTPAWPAGEGVVLACPVGWAAPAVAAAITAEQVVPAWATPTGTIALTVGPGYAADSQQQIVLAVAKVWHGLCEVHTPAINALEAGSCPLPPRLAAWPADLAGPVLTWLEAVGTGDALDPALPSEVRGNLVTLHSQLENLRHILE